MKKLIGLSAIFALIIGGAHAQYKESPSHHRTARAAHTERLPASENPSWDNSCSNLHYLPRQFACPRVDEKGARQKPAL